MLEISSLPRPSFCLPRMRGARLRQRQINQAARPSAPWIMDPAAQRIRIKAPASPKGDYTPPRRTRPGAQRPLLPRVSRPVPLTSPLRRGAYPDTALGNVHARCVPIAGSLTPCTPVSIRPARRRSNPSADTVMSYQAPLALASNSRFNVLPAATLTMAGAEPS